MKKVLGLDFGNVIRPSVPDGKHGSFDLPNNSYLDSPDFPDARNCILEAKRHFSEIHIVSRSDDGRWDDRRRWLTHHGYDGIFRGVHFCTKYEDKGPICAKIGVTHFVDDNLFRVLRHLAMISHLHWFRAKPNQVDVEHLYLVEERKIKVATTWPTLLKILLEPR